MSVSSTITSKNAWVLAAGLAAVFFGVGDFLVVTTEKRSSALVVFMAYSIIIGLVSAVMLLLRPQRHTEIAKLIDGVGWKVLFAIAALHFSAYVLHFYAIQRAANPGYANALVMFHVAVLALLSWRFLKRPLSSSGIIGIAIMFIGAFIVVKTTTT